MTMVECFSRIMLSSSPQATKSILLRIKTSRIPGVYSVALWYWCRLKDTTNFWQKHIASWLHRKKAQAFSFPSSPPSSLLFSCLLLCLLSSPPPLSIHPEGFKQVSFLGSLWLFQEHSGWFLYLSFYLERIWVSTTIV